MFTLRMLGRASLEGPDGPVTGRAVLRHRLALLAILAIEHPRPVSRDELVAYLWPESGSEDGRHQLRDALYVLRSALGDDAVLSAGDELRLNPDRLTCDVWDFEAALMNDLAAAVSVYRGPLLTGFYLPDADELERWTDSKRAQLARRYVQALEQVAEREMQGGDPVRAVEWWASLASEDPYNSRIALRYMQALEAAGDRAGALRHASVHSELLRTELGAVPEKEIEALAKRLRTESRAASLPSPAPPSAEGEPSPGPPVSVHMVEGAEAPAPPAEGPVLVTGPSRADRPPVTDAVGRSPRRWILVAVLGLGLVTGFEAIRTVRTLEGRQKLNPRRVAVAVFENRTGRPDLDDLGSLTADWIMRGLMETPLIKVTDLQAVYARPADRSGERTDPRVLARRDGAGLVVSGSYYRSGDSVLFEAGIVDVPSGRVLRSFEPVGSPIDAPSVALEGLRDAIAAGLGALVDPANNVSPVDPDLVPPPSYPAYREFIAGLKSSMQDDWDAEGRHYRRAAELDSGFVAPLIQLAFRGMVLDQCRITDSVATVLDGRRARLTAWDRLTIDMLSAQCHGDMATVVGLLEQRYQAYPHSLSAARQYQSALQRSNQPRAAQRVLRRFGPALAPGRVLGDEEGGYYWSWLAASHHMLGQYPEELAVTDRWHDTSAAEWQVARGRALAGLGRESEVLELIQSLRARSIDSVATPSLTIAAELAAHGHQRAAAAVAESTLHRLEVGGGVEPDRTRNVALANLLLGRRDQERSALEQIVLRDPDSVEVLEAQGRLAVLVADTAAAERVDRVLAEQSDRPLRIPTARAVLILARAHIAAGLGRRDLAVTLLRDASARGMLSFGPSHVYHADPLLAPLKGYPPFDALLVPDN